MASWLSNAARPPSPAKLCETRLCAILFILMYAIASRRQPTRATRGRVTFFEEFCPAGLFLVERADSAAWPHRNRGTCGFTRDPAESVDAERNDNLKLQLGGALGCINTERAAKRREAKTDRRRRRRRRRRRSQSNGEEASRT